MPEPNLFKLSSAVQGNNSFVLIYVFPKELTQHCYYLVGAGSLKPCCHYTWISFQHLSKISSKIMPDQGIPPQHTLIFCSKPPTPLHSTFLISSGYSSTLLKEPNCIQLSEKIFRILATSEEQDYMSSYICQNSRKTSSFKLLIQGESRASSKGIHKPPLHTPRLLNGGKLFQVLLLVWFPTQVQKPVGRSRLLPVAVQQRHSQPQRQRWKLLECFHPSVSQGSLGKDNKFQRGTGSPIIWVSLLPRKACLPRGPRDWLTHRRRP